ncbi:MAG: FimB/Mfa2 family fimbrial subunit [Barnesiella sp.]|nr:FimB/Mfa2 family fimbrial subunit [Barnesiella sp.]MBD5343941.1 FimB/Mfa2 family fimbrial subunit [Bacteroides sp.]
MLLQNLSNKFRLTLAAVAAGLTFTGCSSFVYDDLPECPAQLNVKFQFNYTLDRGEAFAAQVHSVNVWAFDQAGNFVWSGSAAGESLASPDFQLETTLGEGVYDFVAWCGLDGNDDFSLATYTPASMQELEMKLVTLEENNLNISSSHFKSLFHGMKSGVKHTINHYAPSITTVTIPLIKDTNDIAVMLMNTDGTVLNTEDFSVSFTYADSWLAWDNAVMTQSPTVTYTPWSQLYGESTSDSRAETDDVNDNDAYAPVRSTLLYELSVSRLMTGGNAYLDIVRNTDGERIIHVPLIDFFILEKGNRYDMYGDQEYLDRRSDYSALFFIDNDMGWYMAGGIYINGWAIVPPQSDPIY